jgi:lysophospholipase L1-like esterase
MNWQHILRENNMRICVFGDSIVWGANDPINGWVALLSSHAWKKEHEVCNLGITGDTTDDLLKRFMPECKMRNPKIIIVAAGLNDAQVRNKRVHVSQKKFEHNIFELIRQGKKFTNTLCFIGPTVVDERKTTPVSWVSASYFNEKSLVYETILKNCCQKMHVQFISVFDVLSKKDLDDGVHPTIEGHKKLFMHIKQLLPL